VAWRGMVWYGMIWYGMGSRGGSASRRLRKVGDAFLKEGEMDYKSWPWKKLWVSCLL